MNLMESLILWLMSVPRLPAIMFLSLGSIIIGFILAANPRLAIEIQKRFYARINWRIEPISMEKEIRNTRLMGIFLIIFAIIILAAVLTNKSLL